MSFAPSPAAFVHRRPIEDEADDQLAFQRVMLWLRMLGVAIILTQGWLYEMLHPALLWAVVLLEAVVVATQGRILRPGLPLATLRRRATLLLVADLVAVYAIGTNFTADPHWIGFYFYPLMSLEAAIIAGLWAGIAVTILSVIVYCVQLVLHELMVPGFEPKSALAAISLIAMTGGFMTMYAHLSGRGRNHLRAMLHLTSALARHEHHAEAIRHLDRRLQTALGARVRSIAVREASGGIRIIGTKAADERTLTRAQLARGLGDLEAMDGHLEAGESITLETDAWAVLTATLGLPDWAMSITVVPIVAEGRWVGVMPVLWPTRTIPDRDQVRLLNGLAGQLGLTLARDELARMRRDATVDPPTGLLNRRAIGAELDAFVSRAARSGGRLAVLICDFDHDESATGPTAAPLPSVATAVRGALRTGDVAGRHDDNRLLIIAANADAAAARALSHRIMGAVAGVPGGSSLRFSIGVAAFPDDGATAGDLLDAADEATVAAAPRTSAHAYLVSAAEGATAL